MKQTNYHVEESVLYIIPITAAGELCFKDYSCDSSMRFWTQEQKANIAPGLIVDELSFAFIIQKLRKEKRKTTKKKGGEDENLKWNEQNK